MSGSSKFLRNLIRSYRSGLDNFKSWLRANALQELKPKSQEAVRLKIDKNIQKYTSLADQAGPQLLKKVASLSENSNSTENFQTAQAYLTKIVFLSISLKKNFELNYIREVQDLISGFNIQEQFSLRFLQTFEEIIKERLLETTVLQPSVKIAARKLLMRVLNQKRLVFEHLANPDKLIETTKKMLKEFEQIKELDLQEQITFEKLTTQYAKYCEQIKADKQSALHAYEKLMDKPFFINLPSGTQFKIMVELVRLYSDVNVFKELPEEIILEKETHPKLD